MHDLMRRRVMRSPFPIPKTCTACIEYSEQVGLYRQQAIREVTGRPIVWYNCTQPIKSEAVSCLHGGRAASAMKTSPIAQ